MRVGIAGQFGFGNTGDEAVLQAIMDSLGLENEYIICTPLPFNMTDAYSHRVPNAVDVRTLEDARIDFDVCLYGGGKVDWGFAWNYFIKAFNANVKTMAYGISIRTDTNFNLTSLYSDYMERFGAITVRDQESAIFMRNTFAPFGKPNVTLTMCPAINLKGEKTSVPDGKVAVCPRYGDYSEKGEVDNTAQIDWFVKRLASYNKKSITLIPFYPKDLEGNLRDLELCQQINRRLGGGCNIFPNDGYNPRKIKYAIANSELVLSGGRYHAIVWAIAHDIPYEISPLVTGIAWSKLKGLVEMDKKFGREKLLQMELKNKKLFEAMF